MPLPLPENTPLEFSDQSRWFLRESTSLSRPQNQDGSWGQIPEFYFSTVLVSPVIAIQAASLSNLGRKRKVGRLLQTVTAGIQEGSTAILSARSVWLGLSIFRFAQDLDETYQVRFLAGLKIPSISLLLFEYQ